MDKVADRMDAVHASVAEAARRAGRDVESVTVVAVSKKQPDERVDAALAAGHRVFGENRVQEAMARWSGRKEAHPDLHLRLVGPLQTNKAADAVGFFDAIESLDREKLAKVLAKECEAQGRAVECLVQVNTGEEEQKAGVAPAEALEFVRYCRGDLGLNVTGLMCIPPVDEEAAMHFALLGKMAREAGLPALSMGMSADYGEAIAFGATHVRVGSAFFGERPDSP